MSGTEKWDWEASEKPLADLREISERFSACHEPVVSRDGEKIALPVQDEEGAWTICVNGEPWPETFEKSWYHRFGPDGRLAALVRSDDAWTIAVDGVPWDEKFDYVWNPKFSLNGKHIAAQTKREPQDYSIVVDGKAWESTFLSSREFSVGNSGNVGITVQVDPLKEADTVEFMKGTWGLAFNDKVWDTKFVNVYAPAISPDGKSVAAEVRVGICEYSVAVDGTIWNKTFGCVWEPIFHPDGSVIVPARASGAWSLVKDGNPLWEGTYAQLWHQKVSPDGTRIAAIASPTFGKWTIAVDDKPWPTLFSDAVLEPVFSQDSRHVAAVVKHKERWTLAVDGKPWSEMFDMVWNPVFAPDGAMVATKVERKGSYTIALNGKVWNQTFENLWEPEFSPDGTKLLVKAVQDGKYYRRVVPVAQIA